MKLQESVLKHYDQLNDTDLLIWKFILDHSKDVASLTINDLAQKTNVSRTTISRFVRKIGLTGYSELKVLLNMEHRHLNDLDKQVFQMTCDSLVQYISAQKERDYSKVCEQIFKAKRIFIYGSGDIQRSVAKEIKRMFLSAQELIYDIAGSTFDHSMYEMFDEEDLIIIISLSGNSEKVCSIAKRLKLSGCKIISITEFKNNALATMSDENLYIDSTDLHFLHHHPNYKITMPYYLLAELLFIQYVFYKKEQLKRLGQTDTI